MEVLALSSPVAPSMAVESPLVVWLGAASLICGSISLSAVLGTGMNLQSELDLERI